MPDGVLGLDERIAAADHRSGLAAHLADFSPDPNDCVTICWTSGTESTPKGVQRTHYDWMAMCTGTVEGPGLTADDVLLNPFPMVNMAGINGMFLPWLKVGGLLVQHHPFDLATFLRQIEQYRATYTVAPPALLTSLLHNEALLAQADISSLRMLGSGSTPLGGRDDAEGRQDPGCGDQVEGGTGRHHRVLLGHGGILCGGAEPGADRDGGDGEQWDGAFQRDDTAQHGEPGPGEPQQAERPLAVGEPGRDGRGERTAGDRQGDQDHRVRELLVGVVAEIVLPDQVAEGGRCAGAGIRGCVLEHRPRLFDRWARSRSSPR